MDRFGLDYRTLAAERIPRLIYASISGYGQTGPWAGKGGFDLVAQGVSGIMSVTGEPGRPPVKAGIPVTDLGAGLFALAGILAALHHRDRTGRGQHIDTSLGDAGLALSVWEATEYFGGRGVPGPLGSAHRMSAPYQAVRCADGYITLGAANQRTFEKVADVLGHPEWIADPRFASDTTRVAHREALAAAIEAVTVTATRAEWLDASRRGGRALRADPRLRRGLRPAAGPGPRDVDRGRPPRARPPADDRHADQDVRDAARSHAAGRRCSANTPRPCSARSAITDEPSPSCAASGRLAARSRRARLPASRSGIRNCARAVRRPQPFGRVVVIEHARLPGEQIGMRLGEVRPGVVRRAEQPLGDQRDIGAGDRRVIEAGHALGQSEALQIGSEVRRGSRPPRARARRATPCGRGRGWWKALVGSDVSRNAATKGLIRALAASTDHRA